MIHDSVYWKKELYASFLTLAKARRSKRATELALVKIEKALMIGAYVIRKLAEAQKIPPDFLDREEHLRTMKNKGTLVDHLNWHKAEDHYDFSAISFEKKDWRFIANQLIHSFSFFIVRGDGGVLEGFWLNSDFTKKDRLFYLSMELLFKIFLSISEGDITAAHHQRQVIGQETDGSPKFGAMKLTGAVYSYPNGFSVEAAVADSLKGNIYRRSSD